MIPTSVFQPDFSFQTSVCLTFCPLRMISTWVQSKTAFLKLSEKSNLTKRFLFDELFQKFKFRTQVKPGELNPSPVYCRHTVGTEINRICPANVTDFSVSRLVPVICSTAQCWLCEHFK